MLKGLRLPFKDFFHKLNFKKMDQQNLPPTYLLNKLEYFAAHAPEVPEGFQPVMPTAKPEMMDIHDRFYEPEQQEWLGYFWPEGETQEDQWLEAPEVPQSFKDEVTAFLEESGQRYREIYEWEELERIQRVVQWRFHYAESMINQSVKQGE